MISLIQAIIAFVLLGLGTFYYFKTRSPPETPKSGDFDPLEEVEAEPDIKPAKPTPAVTDEPVTDLEPEVIVTPSKPEPENEDEPVKPTPATTPAKPLVPEKPKPTPKPVVFKPEPVRSAVEEPEEPTPTTTPAKPLVPDKRPTQETSMVVGVLGKFASEGGHDVNNGADILSFAPAGSAEINIEHVDVHRADPVNKNGSITFKYRDGTKHKFTFVGNGGLRFRKVDGTFGPNLGVGDASDVVLTGMGLSPKLYKIECIRTVGRNTWLFKPMVLSKGLIGIDMSDNADWGGLRGVYVNVKS